MLKKANDLEYSDSFEPVNDGPELEVMPEDIVRQLSADQKYAYKVTNSIRSGVLDPSIKNHKIGKRAFKIFKHHAQC